MQTAIQVGVVYRARHVTTPRASKPTRLLRGAKGPHRPLGARAAIHTAAH
jgi:hypothetical protein